VAGSQTPAKELGVHPKKHVFFFRFTYKDGDFHGFFTSKKFHRRRFSDSKLEFFGLHVGFQRGQRGNLLKHPKLSTSWVFGQTVCLKMGKPMGFRGIIFQPSFGRTKRHLDHIPQSED
jgi:hypothetical protein